ncbi:MAG: hypothetical protein PHC97_00315 [Patescibacteria group bacterium]|nr:hypothetical protein [Patescibacteria group bacterium]
MDKKNLKVLLVDREDICSAVSRLLRLILGIGSNSIISVNSAKEAMTLIESDPSFFSLLITGNILGTRTRPGLTGLGLVEEVKKIAPDLKVILTSGAGRPSLPEGVIFLDKPFETQELSNAIKKALL